MRAGASSPEELESLLEDAFVAGDSEAFAELFGDGAVLVAGADTNEARGGAEIARRMTAMRQRGYRYLADPRRVIRSRGTTLVVAQYAFNVMHRGTDHRWRYAISLLSLDPSEGTKR